MSNLSTNKVYNRMTKIKHAQFITVYSDKQVITKKKCDIFYKKKTHACQ